MRSDALPRHDRLGHAQLVDAIAQRRDVLLDREVLALLEPLGRDSATVDVRPVRRRLVRDRDAGIVAPESPCVAAATSAPARSVTRTVVPRRTRSCTECARRAAACECPAPAAAAPASIAPCDVDFVHEVHAAAQIEAEAHRLQADARAASAGVRGTLVSATMYSPGVASLIGVARLDLLVDMREAQDQAAFLEIRGRRQRSSSPRACPARAAAPPRPSRRGRRAPAGSPAHRRTGWAAPAAVPTTNDDADEPISPGRNLVHA